MQIQYNTLNSSATLHIRYIVSSWVVIKLSVNYIKEEISQELRNKV